MLRNILSRVRASPYYQPPPLKNIDYHTPLGRWSPNDINLLQQTSFVRRFPRSGNLNALNNTGNAIYDMDSVIVPNIIKK